jgi:hypothetical protein
MKRTPNAKDGLLATSAANGSDPILEYVLLGKNIKEGIFAWISFGVDSEKTVHMQPATICSSECCKGNPNAVRLTRMHHVCYTRQPFHAIYTNI